MRLFPWSALPWSLKIGECYRMTIPFPRVTLLIADSPNAGAVTEIVRGAGGEVIPCSADLGDVTKISRLVQPGLAVISSRSGSVEECATLVGCLAREGIPVLFILEGEDEGKALFTMVQEVAPTAYLFPPVESKTFFAAAACATAPRQDAVPSSPEQLAEDRTAAQERTIDLLNHLGSNIRHDILNKLTVVLGYLEFVKEGVSDPAILGLLAKMETATQAIQWQVTFTRAYQDIGKGGLVWHNLREVILLAKAHTGNPSIIWEIGFNPVRILADPLLPRVFQNLATNVVRHATGATVITVTTRKEGGSLVIDFKDNGPGIAEVQKEKIFERNAAKTPEFSLYLCRQVLGLTGGTIHETGRTGEGACFTLTVPAGGFEASSS